MTNGHDSERDGFHKVSFEIGRNAEGLENLTKAFERHEVDDDRRHVENTTLLKANTDEIRELRVMLAPIAANYRLTKRRLALVTSLGLGVLVVLTWALDATVKWAVGWLLKVKFGG
jgi:hypothetical protein